MTDPGERMPFGGTYEPKPVKKGVKLVNKMPPPQHSAATFEQRATEHMGDKQARNKAVLLAAQQFMGLLKDRTLPTNKTTMAKEIEQQVTVDLTNSALAINQDETEVEGMGSIALINLLFKVSLAQRDRLNEIEYELLQLKKKLSSPAPSSSTNDK